MRQPPSEGLIRAALERIRLSKAFAGSERLLALLDFLLEETLAGRGALLKETVIGNEVYGRKPSYDPRIDSAVRVEVRRLRRTLDTYYEEEGARDDVRIAIPTGQYAVASHWHIPQPKKAESDARSGEPLFESGPGAAVVILPLRNLSRDPLDESFADGLTDELIYAFGHTDGFHVVSRGMAFSEAVQARKPTEIAAELNVDAIIQGTVRHSDGRLRVTIEIADPAGFALWSDRFDAADDELDEFEVKIAKTMVDRVRLDHSMMRVNEVRPRPAALGAHASILRARRFLDEPTPVSLRKALALFEQVAAAAPDYARGYSGIADCYCEMFRLGLIPFDEARTKAGSAARQALDIDPRSVEVHAALAAIAAWLDFDRKSAEACFARSIDLGESARTMRIHAVFLTIFGRHEEADGVFRKARDIEPFSSGQDIAEAVCHYQSRRFHRLIERFGKRWANLPVEARFHLALADIFSGGGPLADDIRPTLDETDLPPTLVSAKAEIEALRGDPTRARSLMEAQTEASHFARATLAVAVGDDQNAFAALYASIEAREVNRAWIRSDARFDRLRDSPRFDELLAAYDASIMC